MLSGQATLLVDSISNTLNPQQGLHVPAGLVHQLCNYGQDDRVLLLLQRRQVIVIALINNNQGGLELLDYWLFSILAT